VSKARLAPPSSLAGSTRPAPAHPPRQKRSALTQDKLLQATLAVLDKEGYDAATVPRIAAEAGLSPAALYRRFANKDDLLRAALLRAIASASEATAVLLSSVSANADLAGTCDALVTGLLKQYRAYPLRLRALSRMITAAPDAGFAHEVLRRAGDNLAAAANVLLTHKDSIRHPDPERAARFALLSAATAIEGLVLEHAALWHTTLPLSDKALSVELTRQMLAYLRRKSDK
jgi:AcrR family transcriptional regulator